MPFRHFARPALCAKVEQLCTIEHAREGLWAPFGFRHTHRFFSIVGFGCLYVIFIACFFPLTLMPDASQPTYRLFNQALYISSAVAALLYALAAARCNKKTAFGITLVGYAALAAGLIATGMSPNTSPALLTIGAGAGCGAGLSVSLVSWFETVSGFQERKGALILGWQAFLGSSVFATVAIANKAFTNEAALALCLVSGALCLLLRTRPLQLKASVAPASFRSGIEVFRSQKVFSRIFIGPAVGFCLIVFIYGIAEAIAMGHDGSPHGEIASYIGAPIGAAVFLAWAYASKSRNYSLAIKSMFLILLTVFWIPAFDAIVLVLSAGFQLSFLLLCSLLLDELSSQRRVAMVLISLGYACMRMLFLIGLYVPGMFGVSSYSSYFESTSLLMFLVYLVFAVALALTWRDRKSNSSGFAEMPDADAGTAPREADEETRRMPADKPEAPFLIAQKYGLTRRETEILALYSKGRDINYMCDYLYLSRNTVKGHVKRIYAKLHIHSKQELIDIVEAVQAEENPYGNHIC